MKSLFILFLFIICNYFGYADEFTLTNTSLGAIYDVKLEIYKNNTIVTCNYHDSNFVYLSTDKGENWNLIYKEKRIFYLPYSSSIQKILFYDEDSFILGFDTGILVITTDKGKNWNEIIPDSTYREAAAYKMFVYNEKVYLFQYKIALESDGNMESWIKNDSPFQLTESTVYLSLQLTKDGYFKSKIYNPQDSITTYMSINTKNENKEFFTMLPYMYDYFFVNKNTGWCYHYPSVITSKDPPTKNFQVIYRTDDGGKSWVKQLDTNILNTNFTGINFVDENHGFAYGEWNIIMQTDDGGKNWNRLFSDDSNNIKIGYLYQLKAFDKDNAIFYNNESQINLLRRNTTGVFDIITGNDDSYKNFIVRKGDNIKLIVSGLKSSPSLITIAGKTLVENLIFNQIDENNINLYIPENLSTGFYFILLDTSYGKKIIKIMVIN